MTLTVQIIAGSCLLVFCKIVHLAVVAIAMPMFGRLATGLRALRREVQAAALLSFGVAVVLMVHTIQIWLWAYMLHAVDAFDDFGTSFYFSTATYTTVGYGDLVLGPDLRVFGAFASICGLLAFGISTAFLMGVVVKLLPLEFRADDGRDPRRT